MTRRILVVDNHDSFVHILIDYLRQLGADTELVEADSGTDFGALMKRFDGVLVSPGPGTPTDAGASIAVVRLAADRRLPMLGVCLGHQAIAEAFGVAVMPAAELKHGMVSQVTHDGSALFAGIPSPFAAGRYHSLALEEITDRTASPLIVTARSDSGIVMAVRHDELPIVGVQFHPESILTEGGHRLLANWLESIPSPAGGVRDR